MKSNLACIHGMVAVACVLSADVVQAATATPYGQDAVPETQFAEGALEIGYGVDEVPQSRVSGGYRVDYGMDAIPGSRYRLPSTDVAPQYVEPNEQVLKGSADDADSSNVDK